MTTRANVPVDDVKLSVEREAITGEWRPSGETYTTGTNGLFQFCPEVLRGHARVRLVATRRSSASVDLVVDLSDRLTVIHLRFEPDGG